MSGLNRDSLFTGKTIDPSVIKQLSFALNNGDVYKELGSEIKKRNSNESRFSSDDMSNFARSKNPSQALLDAWMTQAPTIGNVISTLDRIGLIRQCNIIRERVLRETPVEPSSPEVEELKEATDGPVKYRYETLVAWTDSFNEKPLSCGGRLIGEGGFAKVYLGLPKSHPTVQVAVKKLYNSSSDSSSEKQFRTEIDILSRNTHQHILGLLGYCESSSFQCIVYPYMTNGSLDKCLCDSEKRKFLTAKRRTTIATESAEGICHLHSLDLVHRDLKSANLLLDDQFVVKVGDCGLVKLVSGSSPARTHTLATSVIGTPIYMPLEYIQSGEVSVKLDAYSYGVILLELITGLPAIDESREEVGLPDYVEEHINSDGTLKASIIDQTAGEWPENIVQTLFSFSQSFLETKKKLRGTISESRSEIVGLCSSFP